MSWKKYRELFQNVKINESQFILGVDIGNSTSAIAYYDVNRSVPEIIDISGGYGKPSVPTAMQYVSDSREWIFGEYAVLNSGVSNGVTFFSLLEKLAKNDYLDIGDKPVSAANVLSLYLKELIGNCKNINPKAEIAGIIFSVPSYLSEDAKASFKLSIRAAGYERAFIEFVSDRECIFNRYYAENPISNERLLLLDFAGRELRGGIYEISPSSKKDGADIVSISSLFDKELGTQVINEAVNGLFTNYYCTQMRLKREQLSDTIKEQIAAFTYQHRDLLFQKNERNAVRDKAVKLYFNFAYPPFQKTVENVEIETFIEPFRKKMLDFFQNVFKRTLMPEDKVTKNDISTVLCTGGGFEMSWAKKLVSESFTGSRIVFYKNSKGALAEGACLIASGRLSVTKKIDITMSDFHKLKVDIGIMTSAGAGKKDKFVPLVEQNSFWWQVREQKSFIINEPINGEPFNIPMFKRDANGEITKLGEICLEDLPERPEGATKIGINLTFPSYDVLTADVADLGFGELFPSTGYRKNFVFDF